MKIILAPVRGETRLALHRAGDTLTFNGEAVDLASYVPPDPEAANPAPGCPWIIGQPVRGPNGWEVTVLFPYGPGAPEAALWPAPITLVGDGPVPLPPADPFGQDAE